MIWTDEPGNDSVRLSRIYRILNEGMNAAPALLDEVERLRESNREWIAANCPDGWIGQLRADLAEAEGGIDAQRKEIDSLTTDLARARAVLDTAQGGDFVVGPDPHIAQPDGTCSCHRAKRVIVVDALLWQRWEKAHD